MAKKDYKSLVLDYLESHPNEKILRTELIEKLNISKSRLSEVLLSIKKDGYDISSPPRSGIIYLNLNSSLDLFPTIKDNDIREWVILFLLSTYEKLTFNQLLTKMLMLADPIYEYNKILEDTSSSKKAYDDSNLIKLIRKNVAYDEEAEINVAKDYISVTALRKDLTSLRERNLVKMKCQNHTYYSLTNKAPYIIPLSSECLYQLCVQYEESTSSTADITPLKNAISKIQKLIDYEDSNIALARFGKINEISQSKLESFSSFVNYPYKTSQLKLESKYNGITTNTIFSVGLIFYSVETNSFYAFGKNAELNRFETKRIDYINSITVLEEPNNEFHKQYYYDYYTEMFSAAYESQSYRVKVLFADYGNIKKRFGDLCSIRKHSQIRTIDNPPDDCIYKYVYEDTIRGLSSFSRYLRSFGMSVLAIEPPELRENMIYTYTKIIEKYGENNE